jgi:transketolase
MMPNAEVVARADQAFKNTQLDDRSLALRRMVVEALDGGGRGHLGSAFSAIEILRVLYDQVLTFDAAKPGLEERDRCILSKGHGCLAHYAILADKGFFARQELSRFCHFDSFLGGHPDAGKVPGIEASTGALGHGPSIGLGMAMGLRLKGSRSRVFVITGDGEINEGSVWEAAMCAGKHGLENLTIIVDYNKHQSYASTAEVQDLEPLGDKWRAFGFAVEEVDGHDVAALQRVFAALPFKTGKPNAVICHTVKGRGISFAENNVEWHHKSRVPAEQIEEIYRELGGK